MLKLKLYLCSFIISISSLAFGEVEPGMIYEGTSGEETSLERLVDEIEPGEVIVLSELHGLPVHHKNQIQLLKALKEKGFHVSVGMEHLFYLKQNILDQYLAGHIFEGDFLKKMSWGNPSFDYYRYQVNFPLTASGTSIALKAPSKITRKVAKEGLESLTEKEFEYLPPQFKLGNDKYLERFVKAMGGHADPDDIRKYFEAQSIWDETMAWKTREYVKGHSNHVFVLIVGDFHASYFGGLPDRLAARGQDKLTVISQVNINGLKQGEAEKEVFPSEKYGPRGDYVWVSSEEFPAASFLNKLLVKLDVF